jgi:hypothetical protein
MSNALPNFHSAFLQHICRRVGARRKALRYHGTLTWETTQPDDFEWLSVYFAPLVGNYAIFQFSEDNRVSIYIRKSGRRLRGKVLLAIEDIRLVDNPKAIVGAMETTITQSWRLDTASEEENAVETIRRAWADASLRIAEDQ